MTHPVLESVLSGLTGLDGFRLACLVDPVTGTVLEAVPGRADPRLLEVAGSGSADLLRALLGTGARLTPESEVQDVVVTLSECCYVLRLLPVGGSEPLALLLVIDRGATALAFALREVRRLVLDGMRTR